MGTRLYEIIQFVEDIMNDKMTSYEFETQLLELIVSTDLLQTKHHHSDQLDSQ